jgi:hypothetical protein
MIDFLQVIATCTHRCPHLGCPYRYQGHDLAEVAAAAPHSSAWQAMLGRWLSSRILRLTDIFKVVLAAWADNASHEEEY